MRTLAWIGLLWVGFVSGGATCARRDQAVVFPPPPPVLSETPSAEEMAEVLNRTDAIIQLSTNSASLDVTSMPALPTLSATIHLQRDRNFRLQASLPVVMGSGLDLGSNPDVFWFEVPEGVSKTLYYARHDEYRRQLHRAILPVDPTWLIEAMGLVHLDPASVIAGPVRRPDGRLEIRNTIETPSGTYQRVCYVQHPGGYVTHQFLYAPGGQLVATSEASNHRFYEEQQCALPHRVRFELRPAGSPPLSMQVDIGAYVVNQLLSSDPNLFVMPQTAARSEDLTRLSAAGPAPQPTAYRAEQPKGLPLRGTHY